MGTARVQVQVQIQVFRNSYRQADTVVIMCVCDWNCLVMKRK